MNNKLFDRIPRERLDAYLDGTLDEQQTAEMDSLLDNDAELQKFVDDYIHIQMNIANSKEECVDFSESVPLEAVTEINKAMQKVKPASSTSWKQLRWVAGVAVLVAISAIGYLMVSPVLNSDGVNPGQGAVRGTEGSDGSGVFEPGNDIQKELASTDSLIDVIEGRMESEKTLRSDSESNQESRLYELKWKRILLLKQMNDFDELHNALEEILKMDGCHREEAEQIWQDYFAE